MLIVAIKVIPSSGKQAWKLEKSGILKCYLKSAAERGLANAELIKMIAHALKISQDLITIVVGQTSRNKKIKIEQTITMDQFLSKIGVEKQLRLID